MAQKGLALSAAARAKKSRGGILPRKRSRLAATLLLFLLFLTTLLVFLGRIPVMNIPVTFLPTSPPSPPLCPSRQMPHATPTFRSSSRRKVLLSGGWVRLTVLLQGRRRARGGVNGRAFRPSSANRPLYHTLSTRFPLRRSSLLFLSPVRPPQGRRRA